MDSNVVPFVFSGWEPHNVVAWVQRILLAGLDRPRCQVVGREPVTSTAIFLDGVVTEERHQTYDRGFTLSGRDTGSYKVGGTNTTSSIAAFFTIMSLPIELAPAEISSWDSAISVIESLNDAGTPSQFRAVHDALDVLEFWTRAERIVPMLDETLLSYMPSAREFLSSVLVERDRLPLEQAPSDLFDSICRAAGVAAMMGGEISIRACRILGVLNKPDVIEHLVRAVAAERHDVSRPAALALRATEFEFQRLSTEAPLEAESILRRLAAVMSESADGETRTYLAEALGYLGVDNPAVLRSLRRTALDDDQMHVRWASVVSLGRVFEPSESIDTLSHVIASDQAERVVRASLVSLGRLFRRASLDATGVSLHGVSLARLTESLGHLLEASDTVTVAYAAYALGESPACSKDLIRDLGRLIDPNLPYIVVAHALLALSKLEARQLLEEEEASYVAEALPRLIRLEFDSEHPGSSYHEWFVLAAWRLLSRLEMPGAAARFAREAALIFKRQTSRAQYFEGLSALQVAEDLLQKTGRESDALNGLRVAIEHFNAASQRKAFVEGSLSDSSSLAAVTRARWAKARSSFIEALTRVSRSSFRSDITDDHEAVKRYLAQARQYVLQIIESRPQLSADAMAILPIRAARPIGSEAILGWFRDSIELLGAVEDLRIGIASDADDKTLKRNGALVRAMIGRMAQYAQPANSGMVSQIQDGLTAAADTYRPPSGAEIDEIIECTSNLLISVTQLLWKPIPLPDIDHQLLGMGRARFSVFPDSAAQVSVQDGIESWVYRSDSKITLRAVVQVDLLSDDELLVLSWRSSEAESGKHIVRIHEGSESLEFSCGSLPSGSTLSVDVSLSLVAAGYAESIADWKAHIQTVGPAMDHRDERLSELARLRLRRQAVERDLEPRSLGVTGSETIAEWREEKQRIEARIGELVREIGEDSDDVITLAAAPRTQKNGVVLAVDATDFEIFDDVVAFIASRDRAFYAAPHVLSRRSHVVEVLVDAKLFSALRPHLKEPAR